jgi:hypothetical protein
LADIHLVAIHFDMQSVELETVSAMEAARLLKLAGRVVLN